LRKKLLQRGVLEKVPHQSVVELRNHSYSYTSGYGAVLQRSTRPHFLALALGCWGMVLVWLLGATAMLSYVPALLYWSRSLGLQPEVAGATLVALGHSLPDLLSAGVAAEKLDLPLALSQLFGTSMVGLTVTSATVLVIGRRYAVWKQRTPDPVSTAAIRDVFGAYAIALASLASTIYSGSVTLAEALCLPCVYVVFVVVVAWVGSEEPAALRQLPSDELSSTWLSGLIPPMPAGGLWCSWLLLLLWAVKVPLHAVRWFSIPPADGHWDRSLRIVCSIAPVGLLAFLLATGWVATLNPSATLCVGSLSVAALLGRLGYAFSGDGPELPSFYPCMALIGCLASAIWLVTVANELSAVVEGLGVWLEVPPLRLGFTAVAWGNSLGDALSCAALASCGQMRVAFAAAVAAPLYDILVRYGLTLSIAASTDGGKVYLSKEAEWPSSTTVPLTMALCCIPISLSISMLVMWRSTSPVWPWVQYAFYVIFAALILCTT